MSKWLSVWESNVHGAGGECPRTFESIYIIYGLLSKAFSIP